MVSNISVSLVTSIFIWDLAMSGWFVNHSGWNVFMDGKEAIPIGESARFAMIVTEGMPMDVSIPGVHRGGTNRGRTNIDWSCGQQ